MNKETLLQLVERLRGAGQMDHLSFCNKHGSRPPWDHCNCIASDHNSAVDAAAKALVAEIEGGIRERREWQCGCGHWNSNCLAICAQCGRKPGETT